MNPSVSIHNEDNTRKVVFSNGFVELIFYITDGKLTSVMISLKTPECVVFQTVIMIDDDHLNIYDYIQQKECNPGFVNNVPLVVPFPDDITLEITVNNNTLTQTTLSLPQFSTTFTVINQDIYIKTILDGQEKQFAPIVGVVC